MYPDVIPPEDFEYICGAGFIPWTKLHGKTIMITGATGLVGSTVVEALLFASEKWNLGLSVLALVRNREQAIRRFGNQLTSGAPLRLLTGTVEEPLELEGPVDYVIHGASLTSSKEFVQQPVETIRTAVVGTLQMLELARRKNASGFVYLSSMEVYGHPPQGHIVEETDACSLLPMEVRSSYPISKLQSENLCCAYAAEYGVPAMTIRLAQIFGPGMRANDMRIFAELERCIRNGQDFVLRTEGETERSYLYIADAVSAILTVLLKGRPGRAYNAADESTYCSIAEMVQKVTTANRIGLRFELEGDDGYGYPSPAYLDLDTARLQALGWVIPRREMEAIISTKHISS